MKIVEIEIEKLKPYKLNAKTHPQSQIEGIAESLKRFGINQPAVIDKENEIVVGHGRIEAAKLAGFKTFPCVVKSDLTEQEIKAYRLIDNRISETPWDKELLNLDLQTLEISLEEFNVDFQDQFQLPDLDPNKEWEGMPEFEQKDLLGIQLVVHFKTEEDKYNFAELIDQKITEKTKFIWYPYEDKDDTSDLRFVNEEKIDDALS